MISFPGNKKKKENDKKTTRVDKKVECVTLHKARLHMKKKGDGGQVGGHRVTRTSKRILLQFTKTPNNSNNGAEKRGGKSGDTTAISTTIKT